MSDQGASAVRVFISHSHLDDEFAARLAADLQEAGVDVWLDSGDLEHGDFLTRINTALASREWLILVLTPNAVASPWVEREVHAALKRVVDGRMRDVLYLEVRPDGPSESES